jgi:hypothetical protein
MKPRIAIFNHLGRGTAVLTRLLVRLGFDVVYFELAPSLDNPGTIERLARSGVCQIDYSKLPDYDAFADDRIVASYAADIVTKLLPLRSVDNAASQFPPVSDQSHKVKVLIYKLVLDSLRPQARAFALANYHQTRGATAILWPVMRPLASVLFDAAFRKSGIASAPARENR